MGGKEFYMPPIFLVSDKVTKTCKKYYKML